MTPEINTLEIGQSVTCEPANVSSFRALLCKYQKGKNKKFKTKTDKATGIITVTRAA